MRNPFGEMLDRVLVGLDQINHIAHLLPVVASQVTRIEIGQIMTNAQSDQAWDEFNKSLDSLVEGYKAKDAENKALHDALSDQDRKTQDAVNKAVTDALAADDAYDAERVRKADQVVRDGLNPPQPTTPDGDEESTPDVPGESSDDQDVPNQGTPTEGGVPAGND